MKAFDTPILFLAFNRPSTTQRVFKQIAMLQPQQLFIAADGPRDNHIDDATNCEQVRDMLKDIPWECSVKYLYRTENLGCRNAVYTAINWFFQHVEAGIILEDDCLPDPSFFFFCQALLEKYRTDNRVMMISGDNFQDGIQRGTASYYFSQMAHIWGWATWRRAWNLYDVEMKDFPAFLEEQAIRHIWKDRNEQDFWIRNFTDTYDGKINTWDYIWVYTMMKNNALAAMPNVNLVSNIGFGEQATHTSDNATNPNAGMKTSRIDINQLTHPRFVLPDTEADTHTHRIHNKVPPFTPPLFKRIFNKPL